MRYNEGVKLFWDVLSKRQTEILPRLSFLKDKNFYLAGGTALALQIKHRTSIDFDFYIPKEFDAAKIYRQFQEQKPNSYRFKFFFNKLFIFSMCTHVFHPQIKYTLLWEICQVGVLNHLKCNPTVIVKSYIM